MSKAQILSHLTQLLAGRIPARPDWDALMQLAGEQLVVTQLMARLEPVRDLLPPEALAYLQETRRRSEQRNARLRGTLADTLGLLNAAGIEPVLLKGAALLAVETGPADRLVRDIDLLVKPEEMQRAVDALADAGFAVLSDERAASVHDVVVLGREHDVGSVDIHQHAPARTLRSGCDDIYAFCRRVDVAGGIALSPSPEAQILVMAVHDQIHDAQFWRGGFNLRHLLDIAAIARQGADWDALMKMCRTRTERVALCAELHAARSIAGAEIPSRLLDPWSRLHYWRQRAQFAQPALTTVIERVRRLRAAAHALLQGDRPPAGVTDAQPAS